MKLGLKSCQGQGAVSEDFYENFQGGDGSHDDIFTFQGAPQAAGLGKHLRKDKSDLLDRLVLEDQEEKLRQYYSGTKQHITNMEMENILKLLQLQQSTGYAAPEGRAIIRSNNIPMKCPPRAGPSLMTTNTMLNQMNYDNASTQYSDVSPYFSSKLQAPLRFKVPPPYHPPAVSANSVPNIIHKKESISKAAPVKGSVASVQLRVEQVRWQLQALEVERKNAEAALAKQNPGMGISSYNNVQTPRLPLRPSQLDKLLVDSWREQARVLTLLNRVKAILRNFNTAEFSNILAIWKQKILGVMAIRRESKQKVMEVMAAKNGERVAVVESGDLLEESLACMGMASRKARTVLWALLMKAGSK